MCQDAILYYYSFSPYYSFLSKIKYSIFVCITFLLSIYQVDIWIASILWPLGTCCQNIVAQMMSEKFHSVCGLNAPWTSLAYFRILLRTNTKPCHCYECPRRDSSAVSLHPRLTKDPIAHWQLIPGCCHLLGHKESYQWPLPLCYTVSSFTQQNRNWFSSSTHLFYIYNPVANAAMFWDIGS